MPIFVPDIVSEKGNVDAKRHRDKQRESIKKRLPEIIADESIITSKRGKTVKIPIKGIQIPYFRSGIGGKGLGIGQGEGSPGDIIGKRPGEGRKPGQAGSEPGEDYIETEVEMEELLEMVLEDIGLPRLEEKEVKRLIVELGYKIHGHTRSGPPVLLDSRRTMKEGMKRFWGILASLEIETGRDQLVCFNALKKTGGSIIDSLELLKDPTFIGDLLEVEPFPIIETEDKIFHKIEDDVNYQSNAVIIAMMDVSVSMTTEKKYLARSMMWWLVCFLKMIYEKVEIRFIVHHTEARIVQEEDFFRIGESGGTHCYSAYELAGELIDAEFPLNQWNVYAWHFSDGDDFNVDRTIKAMENLFARNINMFGYGEIKPEEEMRIGFNASQEDSDLLTGIKQNFDIQEIDADGSKTIIGKDEPLLCCVIRKREHLLPALKQFLKKERWTNE